MRLGTLSAAPNRGTARALPLQISHGRRCRARIAWATPITGERFPRPPFLRHASAISQPSQHRFRQRIHLCQKPSNGWRIPAVAVHL